MNNKDQNSNNMEGGIYESLPAKPDDGSPEGSEIVAFEGVPLSQEDQGGERLGTDRRHHRLRLCALSFFVVFFLVLDLRAISFVDGESAAIIIATTTAEGTKVRGSTSGFVYDELTKDLHKDFKKNRMVADNLRKDKIKTRPSNIRTKREPLPSPLEITHETRTANSAVDVFQDNVRALTADNFDEVLSSNKHVFVFFYATWCNWCKKMAPTWAEFALEAKDLGFEVVKVDCTGYPSQSQLCREQKIMAYPTLSWFHNGQRDGQDYRSDRTVKSFLSYACGKMGHRGCEDVLPKS